MPQNETINGTFPEKKAAPRVEMLKESSLTRMKAAKKGSLATEEGGPRDQVGSTNGEDTLKDRCLSNNNFEDECGSGIDHQVVKYQEFVQMFVERSEEPEPGFEVGHVVVIVPPFFDHSQRKAIRDAGAISGIYVCRISSEPKPATKP